MARELIHAYRQVNGGRLPADGNWFRYQGRLYGFRRIGGCSWWVSI